jgi:hypothetical protein
VTDPFGLQLEFECLKGGVTGRFLVEQEHPALLMVAMEEAMAQTAGKRPERIDLTLRATAPVGTFVRVTGWVEVDGAICASASTERGELLAEAATVDAGAPSSSPSVPS